MMLLHTGRAAGKTTQAMAWVSQGVPTTGYICTRREHTHYGQPIEYDEIEVCNARPRASSYPGWTRVLVVVHFAEFERLKKEWWSRLEDFDHRVYSYTEWVEAHNVHPQTEVCIDNLDILLGFADLRVPGRIVAATITAQEWEPQTFRKKVSRDEDD